MYVKGDTPTDGPLIHKTKSKGIFSKKKISISISGSQWSERVSMDTTGSSLVVKCVDNKDGQVYTMGWTVTMTSSSLTKVVDRIRMEGLGKGASWEPHHQHVKKQMSNSNNDDNTTRIKKKFPPVVIINILTQKCAKSSCF